MWSRLSANRKYSFSAPICKSKLPVSFFVASVINNLGRERGAGESIFGRAIDGLKMAEWKLPPQFRGRLKFIDTFVSLLKGKYMRLHGGTTCHVFPVCTCWREAFESALWGFMVPLDPDFLTKRVLYYTTLLRNINSVFWSLINEDFHCSFFENLEIQETRK